MVKLSKVRPETLQWLHIKQNLLEFWVAVDDKFSALKARAFRNFNLSMSYLREPGYE